MIGKNCLRTRQNFHVFDEIGIIFEPLTIAINFSVMFTTENEIIRRS